MSAIPSILPVAGCARRRAKAIARREHVAALATRRDEDLAFWTHGTTPASATGVSVCSCGARSFTRDELGDLDDFDLMHSLCDEYAEMD